MKKNQPQVYQEWLRVVIKQMPHLSKPQAVVLGILLVISVVYRGCVSWLWNTCCLENSIRYQKRQLETLLAGITV